MTFNDAEQRAPGKVYLVGAGPGAADLLTLRAAHLLARADIVFHDALVHPEVLALASRARLVAVGKRCGKHATAQRFINKQLVDAARKHAVVLRLKGGDPMLFGRAQEEIDALSAAGIGFEIVPGVTAALAAAADLGVSLTRRGVSRSVAFATPRVGAGEQVNEWAAAAARADTTAIYMGAGEGAVIAAELLARGKAASLPVIAIESASLPSSRRWHTTLGGLPKLAEAEFTGPVLLLLGEVFAEAVRAANEPHAIPDMQAGTHSKLRSA
jgi:uroporphyrin-III C-methyltransferase